MSCKCDFSVQFKGSAEELFKKVKKLVEQHHGVIHGDARSGSFSVPVPIFGTVAGNYSISGQTCKICITQKSFFLACSVIESFVKSQIPAVANAAMEDL